ncbi:MAG: hypothetical protein ACRDWT_05535, partial [Jatrophihabitantaceae bacterium]
MSGNERRHGVKSDAAKGEDLARSLLLSVVAGADRHVDQANPEFTGIDDPRWQVAEMLADCWG